MDKLSYKTSRFTNLLNLAKIKAKTVLGFFFASVMKFLISFNLQRDTSFNQFNIAASFCEEVQQIGRCVMWY